jgi:hypothetical protein
MSDYATIFWTLFSTLLGYWFCGHSIAVARSGGPVGDGSSSLQRRSHPVRFVIYVATTGAVGVGLALVAVYGYLRLWNLFVTS